MLNAEYGCTYTMFDGKDCDLKIDREVEIYWPMCVYLLKGGLPRTVTPEHESWQDWTNFAKEYQKDNEKLVYVTIHNCNPGSIHLLFNRIT